MLAGIPQFRGLVGVCILLAGACASCTSEPAAPSGGWPTADPETQGFDSDTLAAAVERIDREDLPVDSILVVRNGVLILDSYFYPYLGDRAHDVASVTKSVTSTLVGIAIDQGILTLDQNVMASFPELVPEPPADGRTDIEVQHLLAMTSGFACGLSPGEPELFEMRATDHWVQYALELPMASTPGTAFAYCSPGSHVLSAMVADAAGTSALDFAWDHLFGALGIEDAKWPADPQGVNHGWGDLQLRPRAMAKIGQLFLDGGAWDGRQVVSKEWVEQATQSYVVAEADGTGYGYQWWILAGDFEGLYEARGRGGQGIIVWPEKDVVAVFTGRGVDVRGEVALELATALHSDMPLPPNPEGVARLETALRSATEPPAPTPIPPLPPIAAEVSGKVYRLDANQFDVKCISFRFDSAADVSFELSVTEGTFDLPIGMDGVPRFVESGPTGAPVGAIGEWTDPTLFAVDYDEVTGPNHLRIEGRFAGDAQSVVLEFTDPGEYFPPQNVPASAVASCN
jgi:CubicO group peptidase (beta-lactamase class C family)